MPVISPILFIVFSRQTQKWGRRVRREKEKDSRTRMERRNGNRRRMKTMCFEREWRRFQNVFVIHVSADKCTDVVLCECRHTWATAEHGMVKGQFSRIYPLIWLWVLGIKCRFSHLCRECVYPLRRLGSRRDSLEGKQMCPRKNNGMWEMLNAKMANKEVLH